MRSAVLRLFVLASLLVLSACSGTRPAPSPTRTPTVPPGLFTPGAIPTADQLCQLLTPDDWTAAGLSGALVPRVDSDGPGTGSAYCTYGGSSGAAGWLELDVFASATLDDAANTYATFYESIPTPDTPDLLGVNDAAVNTNIEPGFGFIVARAGRLVVTVTVPASDAAANQLTSLTALVLSRAAALQ